MKNNSKHWLKKADAAWHEHIHAASACAIGDGCAGNLEAHHIITKANRLTRHHRNNGILLCQKHHTGGNVLSAHGSPDKFMEWLKMNRQYQWEWVRLNKWKTGTPDYKSAYERLVDEKTC